MMIMAGKKFQNFLWSSFLIIVQNVNMATNVKCNCMLNPEGIMGKWMDQLGPLFNVSVIHTVLVSK